MKSGRVVPLALAVFALLLGVGVFVLVRVQSQREAELAAHAAARELAAEPASAGAVVETVEVPAAASTVDAPAPASRVEAETALLEVQVLDTANVPVAGAIVALFRADTVLALELTDDEGVVRTTAPGGTGNFALIVAGWEASRGELDLAPGRRTLTLQESAIVSGTVTVDGGLPSEPLQLTWRSNQRKSEGEPLPKAVLKALHTGALQRQSVQVASRADGSFEFRGLPLDASGTIRWSGPFLLEGAQYEHEGSQVQVNGPRRDVVLRLASALQLVLRVVDVEGAPQPRGAVSLKRETKTEHGTSSSSTGTSADRDGRLTQVFAPEPFDTLTVTVSGSDSSGSKEYEFAPPASLRGVWDLGDLATQGTRQITVLVQDPAGRPLEGAQALAWPSPAMRRGGEKTDAAGRMTLKLGSQDTEIAVEAFEFASARFPAPLGVEEVVATLARVCVLEFEAPGVGLKHELAVEVQGPTPLFVDEMTANGLHTQRAIGAGWSSSTDEQKSSITVQPEKTGRWRIAGLVANQPFRASLIGAGRKLCEVEIPPLFEGERRRVELRVDEIGKPLRVRVLSPEGKPLESATVYAMPRGSNGNYRGHFTDANGEVELASLYGDSCRLLAHADGFAPKTRTLRPIPSATVDITLEAPRSVELQLVTRDGAPFEGGAQVRIGSHGPMRTSATALGGGRYRLDGLPSGEVVIHAGVKHGPMQALCHDTSQPVARMVLGEQGTIGVTLQLDAALAEASLRVAVAPAGSSRPTAVDELYVDGDKGSGWFSGLAPGEYAVWVEKFSDDASETWQRVGSPVTAVIDAEHTQVQVALQPPD